MLENWAATVEKPFGVHWQLPGHPGAVAVACGVDAAALHCLPRKGGSLLVYGKIELTVCYESQKKQDQFHFVGLTRYVSVELNPGPAAGQTCLAVFKRQPACLLEPGGETKTQVLVSGVIQLQIPGSAAEHRALDSQPSSPAQDPPKAPAFSRGAETLPPIVWTMPGRG